ncbi:MAG: prenyltransferase/squalene oxidase repeat-containing protein [Thermoplasmatota archaeon]
MKTLSLISILLVIGIAAGAVYGLIFMRQQETTFPLPTTHPAIKNGISYLKNQTDPNGCISSLSVTDWSAIAIAAAEENLSQWESTKQYLITSTAQLNASKATDWERHCLALCAFNLNPYNVSGIDVVSTIKDFYYENQIGQINNIYDDIFGVIALVSAGINSTEPMIQNTIDTIISHQKEDGSWNDVDSTAAAIMALSISESNDSKTSIQQGLEFIKNHQQNNGGFHSWGNANMATTSWALCSLTSINEQPLNKTWLKNNHSPVDFLLNQQQKNGSFFYTENQDLNSAWMTAYALIALTGKTFIIHS